MWLWDQLAAVFDYAQSHLAVTLVAVFVGTLALSFLHASLTPPPKPAVYKCAALRHGSMSIRKPRPPTRSHYRTPHSAG